MPTIQSGSTLERYFDDDTTITITPAAGGSVRFGCSTPVGATRPDDRVVYASTRIQVPGGATVFAQAVGGDASLDAVDRRKREMKATSLGMFNFFKS